MNAAFESDYDAENGTHKDITLCHNICEIDSNCVAYSYWHHEQFMECQYFETFGPFVDADMNLVILRCPDNTDPFKVANNEKTDVCLECNDQHWLDGGTCIVQELIFFDDDNNGKMEFSEARMSRKTFNAYDANGDGAISASEFLLLVDETTALAEPTSIYWMVFLIVPLIGLLSVLF